MHDVVKANWQTVLENNIDIGVSASGGSIGGRNQDSDLRACSLRTPYFESCHTQQLNTQAEAEGMSPKGDRLINDI